jgi:zeaxanthin glucosyltransferase
MKASLALAVLLNRRGHRITLIGPPDARQITLAHGIDFHEIGASVQPIGDLAQQLRTLAKVRGVYGIGRHIGKMAQSTQMFLDELPGALATVQPDAMVIDQMEPAGGLVAKVQGLPFVSLANALPVERDPIVPPVFANWPPETTEFALKRNQSAYRVADWMMRRQWQPMVKFALRHGFTLETLQDTISDLATLVTIPENFDFPRSLHGERMHHVGPIRLPEPENDVAPELEAFCDTDKTLVYASFGTMFGGRWRLFQKLARTCSALDFKIVISHCNQLTQRQADRIGHDAYVTGHLPQRWMLNRADLCVTHAGLNTVVDCLELGVPMLAGPMAFDQPALGARINWTGTGIRLSPARWTSKNLPAAMQKLLSDPDYRSNGAAIREEITAQPSTIRAPELVEVALNISPQASATEEYIGNAPQR